MGLKVRVEGGSKDGVDLDLILEAIADLVEDKDIPIVDPLRLLAQMVGAKLAERHPDGRDRQAEAKSMKFVQGWLQVGFERVKETAGDRTVVKHQDQTIQTFPKGSSLDEVFRSIGAPTVDESEVGSG